MEQVIGSKPVEKEKKGVFGLGGITIGAFLGGPFVCGWMLGENFKELGNPNLAKKYKIGGLIVFIGLIIIADFLDSSEASLGFVSPALALVFFNRTQKKEVEEYIKNGGKKRVMWPKVCIIFTLSLYALFILGMVGGIWADKQIKVQEEYMKSGQEGASLLQAGKYKEAIALFDKNILSDSKDSESYVFRGIAKLQSNDTKGAIEDFTYALTLKYNDLNDRSAYYYRGKAYTSEQKLVEAVSDFTNAIESKISDSNIPDEELYFSRFLVYSGLQNEQEMLNNINEVIKINPNYESATLIRAQLKFASGNIESACMDAQNGKNTSTTQEAKEIVEQVKGFILTECSKL